MAVTLQGRFYDRTQTAKRRKWLSGAVREGLAKEKSLWVRLWISWVCCCLILDIWNPADSGQWHRTTWGEPLHMYTEAGTFLIPRLPPASCGPRTSPMNRHSCISLHQWHSAATPRRISMWLVLRDYGVKHVVGSWSLKEGSGCSNKAIPSQKS